MMCLGIGNKEANMDKFHAHEALDRSLIALEFFSVYVCKHLFIHKNTVLHNMALKIEQDMNNLYQKIGQVVNEEEDINSM